MGAKPNIISDRAARNIMLIDTKNIYNPQYVTDYINDIMDHLKETEVVKFFNFYILINNLQHVNAPVMNQMLRDNSFRSLCVDWIIEVFIIYIRGKNSFIYLLKRLFSVYIFKA